MTAIEDSDLYREILENPADRELRLVFADWLEEQGDPRGQVVRMQCQLEELSREEPGYKALQARERKARKAYGVFGEIPKHIPCKTEVRAGFVEFIQLTPARFMKYAKEIFERAPVHELCLKGASKQFAKMAGMPQLTHLRSLRLRQPKIDDTAFAALVNSPFLRELTELRLDSPELHSAGRTLEESPLLRQLESLQLVGRHVDDRAVESIVAGAVQLRWAQFGFDLSDRSLEVISAASGLRSLESLHLQMEWNADGFTAAGLGVLGNSEFDVPLKELTVVPTARGFGEALRGSRFRQLEDLDHCNAAITTADVVAITENLPNLRRLSLSHTGARDAVARALARSPLLGRLRKLYLGGNRITRAGAEALYNSEHLSAETDILMSENSLSYPELAEIIKAAGR